MGICVSREAKQRSNAAKQRSNAAKRRSDAAKRMSDAAKRRSDAAKRRSNAIDRQLKVDGKVYYRTGKIMLLGASESGKSTIVKQMKIIHANGYSQQQLKDFIPVVYDNVAESIWRVVNGMDRLGIVFQNPVNHGHAQTINYLRTRKSWYYTLPLEVVNTIKSLWSDKGFQECFRRAYEYQLNDSAPYYFENLPRLLAPGYVPTEQDILRSRVATTGIVETEFCYKKFTFRLVDVGGQRTDRRKWIHCFELVTAILFVAALNEYDMTLSEEERVNRLEESLNLFTAVCNNRFLANASIILFLNKMDLFRDKILNSDRHLRLFFPQYAGPDQDVDAAARFIQGLFLECNLNEDREIYTHFTTATSTSNIRFIFDDVLDSVIRAYLNS